MSDPYANRFVDLRHVPLACELDGYRIRMRGWGFFEPVWWRNYLHVHSFYEVCYAFAGRGTFHIDQQEETVQAGDVFVARPGRPHEIISSHEDPLGIYFWSYTVIPPGQGHDGEVAALLRRFCAGGRAVSPATAMQQTLSLMSEEIGNQAAGYVDVLRGLLSKLLIDTARAVTEPVPRLVDAVPGPEDRAAALAHEIQRYLQDNYARPIAMRDIAAQVHLSERHTRRLFQQVTGRTIKAYLTDLRMQVAAQSLLDPARTVTEVATACGYQDVRYFSTAFRRYTGSSPSTYRARGGTAFLNSISD